MYKFFLIGLIMLYSAFSVASSNYQIDVIFFVHPQNNTLKSDDNDFPLIPLSTKARPLTVNSKKSLKPYTLLAPSQSGLADEYYRLTHSSQYQVLGNYSWRQSSTNQEKIALPKSTRNGWAMQGTINVQQSNYYVINAALQLSPPNSPRSSIPISHKQRLKDNVVYYLDHEQMGMLIKIHPV